jgi:hypothetical protein
MGGVVEACLDHGGFYGVHVRLENGALVDCRPGALVSSSKAGPS